MWKIRRPAVSVIEVFDTCVGRVQDDARRENFNGIRQLVLEESGNYEKLASTADLYKFRASKSVSETVDSKEMGRLYKQWMVGSRENRWIYDSLLTVSGHDGICPYCGHRDVSTLDHMLPKACYPVFSITPDNLVPCCSGCNTRKRGGQLKAKKKQYIHPYFDSIDNQRWLHAKVCETSPASVEFFVKRADDWEQVLFERVVNQFEELDLGRLYTSEAARELAGIKDRLTGIYRDVGSNAVTDFLSEAYKSYFAYSKNWWRTACYCALSSSEWYCREGFRMR